MQHLTREQAEVKAQELADETGKPQLIWFMPERVRFKDRYQLVAGRETPPSLGHSVDCKWPMEGDDEQA